MEIVQLTQRWGIKSGSSNHSMKSEKRVFSLHQVQPECNLSLTAVGASLQYSYN